MFIEILDGAVRDRRLVELAGLEGCIALEVLGSTVPARNETRGVLGDRTTAVHYLKFPLGSDLARRLVERVKHDSNGAMFFVISHPKMSLRKELAAATVKSLVEDFV
jgi:hypothetical protein